MKKQRNLFIKEDIVIINFVEKNATKLELDCNYIADILKTRATRQFKER
jgi:hypothetical protein